MLAATAALVLSHATGAPAAAAETITVNTTEDSSAEACTPAGGICSLREALELVNEGTVSGEVVIKVVVSGTISVRPESVLEIDPDSSVSSVAIVGPGAAQLTIDGNKEDEVFEVKGGKVAFSGLTISHGRASHSGGGAIYQRDGEVSLEEMVLTENAAISGASGGAIYQDDGNLLIADSTISDNKVESNFAGVDGKGGGIYEDTGSEKKLTIEGTEIVGNEAAGGGGGIYQDEGKLTVTRGSVVGENHSGQLGGGIYGDGSSEATVKGGSRISLNTAKGGGGIYADVGGSGFTVSNAWISENAATEEMGGGIWFVDGGRVENSTVSKNAAPTGEGEPRGGGIAAGSGASPVAIETSTIAENFGGGVVGTGVVGKGSEIEVRNSTIVANTNPTGDAAGVFVDSASEVSSIAITSSILSGNVGDFGASDCGGTVTSHGHNIVGTTGGCKWEIGTADQFGKDPMLGPLADNGGPTPTMAPVSRQSAAINAGSDPGDSDQRGLTRPVPVGEFNTDVGAVEIQAPSSEAGAPPEIVPSTNLKAGETLTCLPGSWDTDTITDPSFSYEWLEGSTTVGAGTTYVLDEADAEGELRCRVTADDGATSAQATSAAVELGAAQGKLAPASLAFGSRNVGAGPSPSQTLTLSNEGGTDLVVTKISSDDPDFKVAGADCLESGGVLAPGDSCTIGVAFDPTLRGAKVAAVSVASNSVAAPTAEVTGTGTEPELSVTPASFDFGERAVGSGAGAAKAFKVLNTGDGPLEIQEAKLAGTDAGDFALSDDCRETTLPPGAQCMVEVSFDPTEAGERQAQVGFDANATGSAQASGTGTEPALSVSPPSWSFGAVTIGSGPVGKTIVVSDAGTAPLRIGKAAISGPGAASFAIVSGHDGCSERTLEPGDSCGIEVAFEPAEVGPLSAALSLPGQVPGSVFLAGAGEAPPQRPSPSPGPASPAAATPTPAPVPEASPVLVLKRAQGSGEALRLTFECRAGLPRCRGRVVLRAARGPRAEVAVGEVSIASGIQRARLYLTPAGYRLLKAEPGALLEARVTVFDQVTGQPSIRTRTLRVER